MKKSLKRFGGLVIGLKNKLPLDVFASARFKITFLYFIIGLAIFAIAGFFAYGHTISLIQSVIKTISNLIEQRAALNEGIIGEDSVNPDADILMAEAVTDRVEEMILTIGLWMVLVMAFSSYILSGITLRPIKKAMERQKRFIANVSHELRTPLSVMKTNSEVTLLDSEKLSQTELVDALKSNLEEIDRMTKITEFLLSFSRIEKRLSGIILGKVDLSEAVGNSVKLMAMAAAKKKIVLDFEREEDLFVRGNSTALEEMIMNLLKNAIYYTPEGGFVRVRLSRKSYGRRILLSVKDTGVGIAKEELANIFEPFYRGISAAERPGGMHAGLGLAIVKEMADLHKAVISLKSKVGKGTVVFIKFDAF